MVCRLLENANGFVSCAIRMLYSKGFYVYYGVSLTTLCGISWERFIALMYPLRYLEFVRCKRVLKATLFIWLINVLLTSLHWVPEHNVVFRGVHLAMWSASLFIASLFISVYCCYCSVQNISNNYSTPTTDKKISLELLTAPNPNQACNQYCIHSCNLYCLQSSCPTCHHNSPNCFSAYSQLQPLQLVGDDCVCEFLSQSFGLCLESQGY